MYIYPVNHGDNADHSGGGCECLSSDRTGAYVHGLSLMPRKSLPVLELEDVSVSTGGSGARMSHVSGIGVGRPGSVPFAIRVSSTRRLWPPAPGCLCAVEDGPGHVGGI